MSAPNRPEAATARTHLIWADFQKQHDMSDLKGQAAGIDHVSGRIWFGESALDIRMKMLAEGMETPIFYIRSGFNCYSRKMGRLGACVPNK